jgi:hypothetical protein
MTGTPTPSIWRWEQMPSSSREISSRSLTVHVPAIAPGTPAWKVGVVLNCKSEMKG